MGDRMGSNQSELLLRRAGAGDRSALDEVFALHRDRLRRMVQLRLDRRLRDLTQGLIR